jgi:hypothetical protein
MIDDIRYTTHLDPWQRDCGRIRPSHKRNAVLLLAHQQIVQVPDLGPVFVNRNSSLGQEVLRQYEIRSQRINYNQDNLPNFSLLPFAIVIFLG